MAGCGIAPIRMRANARFSWRARIRRRAFLRTRRRRPSLTCSARSVTPARSARPTFRPTYAAAWLSSRQPPCLLSCHRSASAFPFAARRPSRFLRGLRGVAATDAPSQRIHQIHDVLPASRGFAAIAFAGLLGVWEIDKRRFVVILKLLRFETARTSGSRCAWRGRACPL